MSLMEFLLDVQVPSHLRISPNGQQIIYTTSTVSRPRELDRPVSTIWLAQMGQENSARPITTGKVNDTRPEWSPDGGSIAFISDREGPGKASDIYTMPTTRGGEPSRLSRSISRSNIERFQWSPDGRFIAFISQSEKMIDPEQNDANVWGQNLILSRLSLLDATSGRVQNLAVGAVHVTGLTWSAESRRIAYVHTKEPGMESNYAHGSSISVISIGALPLKVRPIHHFRSAIENPSWVGNSLFFTGHVDPTFLSSSQALWSIDLVAENPEFRRRAHGDNDCVGGLVQAGNDVVVSGKQGVDEYIHILDGKTLQTYRGDISSFDVKMPPDSDEMLLAVVKSSVGVPPEVYSTSESNGTHVRLSSHGNFLKQQKYEFGTATVLECQSSDDEVKLNAIYLSPAKPKGKNGSAGPFPTAVICHGGPYARSTDCFNPHATSWVPVLLEAGYGVLQPNYRGGSGRGDAFAASLHGRMGIVDYDDVITLTNHAIETGYADKDYLLIGGWSHGGQLSYQASVRNGMHGLGWRFKAVIAGAGATDPDTMRFTSSLGMIFELDRPGLAPWDSDIDATGSRHQSSTIWAFKRAVDQGGVIPPLLILHCEQDKIVPFEQAVAARRALQHHNLPFEFVSYPREGHRMVEYRHVEDRMERALRWADTYISPA